MNPEDTKNNSISAPTQDDDEAENYNRRTIVKIASSQIVDYSNMGK